MKETHYKLRHRVTVLIAAAVMLCSMLPGAAFAEETEPQPTEEVVQMEQQTEPSETDNGKPMRAAPTPARRKKPPPKRQKNSPLKKKFPLPLSARNCTPICPMRPSALISAARGCLLPPAIPKSAFPNGPKASWKKSVAAI